MPNWCDNTLMIEGDKKQIAKFKKEAKTKESELSFDALLPTPQKYMIQVEKDSSNMNWYSWRLDNWGTKWSPDDAMLSADEATSLEYSFLTAWSPPCEFVLNISKKFKKLRFLIRYAEEGMGYMGRFIAQKGFVVEDQSIEGGF